MLCSVLLPLVHLLDFVQLCSSDVSPLFKSSASLCWNVERKMKQTERITQHSQAMMILLKYINVNTCDDGLAKFLVWHTH